MKYLVDTDWIIDHLNGKEATRAKLKEFRVFGIAVSIISLAELYEGVYQSKDPAKSRKQLDELLTQFTVLSIDQTVCMVFGQERGKLRQRKRLIDNFDLLIASTALHFNLTLLTNNRKHFNEVEGLNIISLNLLKPTE